MANKEIKKAARQLANEIATIVKPTYFDGLPIDEIVTAVEANGFEADDLRGIYCGRDGQTLAAIGHGFGLSIQWHQMESGRYEVVAYVS